MIYPIPNKSLRLTSTSTTDALEPKADLKTTKITGILRLFLVAVGSWYKMALLVGYKQK